MASATAMKSGSSDASSVADVTQEDNLCPFCPAGAVKEEKAYFCSSGGRKSSRLTGSFSSLCDKHQQILNKPKCFIFRFVDDKTKIRFPETSKREPTHEDLEDLQQQTGSSGSRSRKCGLPLKGRWTLLAPPGGAGGEFDLMLSRVVRLLHRVILARFPRLCFSLIFVCMRKKFNLKSALFSASWRTDAFGRFSVPHRSSQPGPPPKRGQRFEILQPLFD